MDSIFQVSVFHGQDTQMSTVDKVNLKIFDGNLSPVRYLVTSFRKLLIHGKAMVQYVQLSTNCRLDNLNS